MPDEMTPSSEEGISKKRPAQVAAAVALLIVLGVAAWYIFKPKTVEPPSGPEVSGLPSTEIDWQKYINQKYGYSLNYPKNWNPDATYAEKDFDKGVGGELILSNKENPIVLLESDNPPTDLITLTLSVYEVTTPTSVDQFIKNKKYPTPFSQAPVIYQGMAGKQMVYVTPRGDTEVLNILTILKKDIRIFVFSWNSFKPDKLSLPKEVETIHDAILRSFGVK
ncbi:MAG: hypothetical protein V1845_04170 [bacterium]